MRYPIVSCLAVLATACGGELVDVPPPPPDAGPNADAPNADVPVAETQPDAAPIPANCSASAPVELASNQPNVTALASDGTHVFWLETASPSGSVMQCAAAGCGGVPSVFESSPVPLAMIVDGSNLYWLDGPSGAISKCPTSGCGGGGTLLFAGLFNPWPILAAGDGEVFAATMPPPGPYGGAATLFACSESGCGSPTTVASVNVFGAAVGGSQVYWRDRSTGDVLACDAKSCASPSVVASHQGFAGGIAATASAVYWTVPASGTVMTCASTGCGGPPTTLASGQSSVDVIAADAVGVVWANGDDIMGLDANAQPRLIAKGSSFAREIALDPCNVYWVSAETIWKASR